MTDQPIEALAAEMKAAAGVANNGARWVLSRDTVSIYEPDRGVANSAWLGSPEKALFVSLANPANVLALLASHAAQAEEIATFGDLQNEHANLMQAHRELEAKLVESEAREGALREALDPFADIGDLLASETEGFGDDDRLNLVTDDEAGNVAIADVSFGDFRRAGLTLQGRG